VKKVIKYSLWSLFALTLVSAIGASIVIFSIIPTLPSIESIRQIELSIPLRIYTIDGKLIAEYGDQRRTPTPIEKAPDLLIKAILSAEDDRFFKHHGVDFSGVIRALIANLESGNIAQGFSTVTMQVAGNYFLDRREKTYTRKIKEVFLALSLERKLSKQKILELYLNKIFLGQRAYGFAAAASVYFNKTLGELTLSEMATLAGIPKAPSSKNPVINPEAARNRRDYVLKRMRDLEHITEEVYLAAKKDRISSVSHVTSVEIEASYVAEMARSYMIENYGKSAYTKGYSVYTTIDSANQAAANQALRNGLIAYDQRRGYRGAAGVIDLGFDEEYAAANFLNQYPSVGGLQPGVVIDVEPESINVLLSSGETQHIKPTGWKWTRQNISSKLRIGDVIYLKKTGGDIELAQIPQIQGAIVSLDPSDGALLALTGGFDFYVGKFNRATQAKRQSGSNIKPFIYSAALDNGYTAATLVSGAPIVVEDNLGNTWRPENYSKKVFGPTRLRKALAQSVNLIAVRLVRGLGTPLVIDHLQQFGFNKEQLPQGLSLALGSANVTPLEMARAYGVFANGGYLTEPYFVARVENQRGAVIEYSNRIMLCPDCEPPSKRSDEFEPEIPYDPRYSKRVLSPENAFLMNELMRGVIQTGTGRGALSLGRTDIAGKTGTTNNFRDAWFSGFNRDVVTSVWVGFDQPKNLGPSESGARAALPIWVDYMAVALEGKPQNPLPVPENIIKAWVHQDTGEAVAVNDPKGFEEYFLMGSEPHALVEGGAPAVRNNTAKPATSLEGLF